MHTHVIPCEWFRCGFDWLRCAHGHFMGSPTWRVSCKCGYEGAARDGCFFTFRFAHHFCPKSSPDSLVIPGLCVNARWYEPPEEILALTGRRSILIISVDSTEDWGGYWIWLKIIATLRWLNNKWTQIWLNDFWRFQSNHGLVHLVCTSDSQGIRNF